MTSTTSCCSHVMSGNNSCTPRMDPVLTGAQPPPATNDTIGGMQNLSHPWEFASGNPCLMLCCVHASGRMVTFLTPDKKVVTYPGIGPHKVLGLWLRPGIYGAFMVMQPYDAWPISNGPANTSTIGVNCHSMTSGPFHARHDLSSKFIYGKYSDFLRNCHKTPTLQQQTSLYGEFH